MSAGFLKAHVALSLIFFTLFMTSSGCVFLKPLTPEEEVAAALMELYRAEKALDVDSMVDAFSDGYSNSQGGNKALLRGYFEGVVNQGVFGSMTIYWGDSDISVDGDTATVTPVLFTWDEGTSTWSFKLKKNSQGAWRIVNSERLDQ